jgi:DNA-binding SARP family transcriptional activator
MAAEYAAAEELAEASNAVVDMVHAGRLDEAERAAHELLERFPEVHDGYDRLGMVYEARGDKKTAADYYRKVIAFVRAHPDQYDPGFEDTFQKLVDNSIRTPPERALSGLRSRSARPQAAQPSNIVIGKARHRPQIARSG